MKRCKKKEKIFFSKNVSEPSNPPDELAQNVSKKSLSDEFFLHFFCKSSESGRFFIYLHDSNSFFFGGPGELIQNGFSAAQYCGHLQNHVRIANFRGESREITIHSKSSYFFVVL